MIAIDGNFCSRSIGKIQSNIYLYYMYQGQIYYQGNAITVQQAVDLGLVSSDANGDIWLTSDSAHLIKIIGDLQLGG